MPRGGVNESPVPAILAGALSTSGGFSLLEVLVVMALLSAISAIAVPSFMDRREASRVGEAITEITALSLDLQAFKQVNGRYPTDLAEAGLDGETDPWGAPYRYRKIEGVSGNNGVRKDRFLVPLNSDYDLYSAGADGKTHTQMSNKNSADDIVRANNGGFVGLGAEY